MNNSNQYAWLAFVTTAVNQIGARTGQHDDLVLALAIACWWSARRSASGRRRWTVPLNFW